MADLYYIESGYLTPDSGYYTYVADAASAQSVTATVAVNAGKLQSVSSSQSVTVDQNTVIGKLQSAVCTIDAAFTPTLTVDVFKNHTAILDNTVTMTIDAVVNRSAQITLSNLINQNAQAVKTVDITTTASVTVITTASALRTRPFASTQSVEATQTTSVIRRRTGSSTQSNETTLSARGFKSYDFPWLLKTSTGSTTRNTTNKAFGASSLGSNSSGSLTYYATDDIQDNQGWVIEMWYRRSSGTDNLASLTMNRVTPTTSSQFSCGASITYAFLNYRLSNGTVRSIQTASNSIALNQWTYLVFTYEASTDTARIYIDGGYPVITDNPYVFQSQSGKKELKIDINSGALLDEVRISYGDPTAIGFDPSQSIPRPTQPYSDNTTYTKFLNHFDEGGFPADYSVLEDAGATLTATATQSTNGNVVKVTGSDQSANTTLTSTGLSLKLASASLSVDSTQSATATKIRYGVSDQTVTTAQSTVIGVIKQFSVTVDSLFTPSVTAQGRLAGIAIISTTASMSVDAVKNVNANSSLTTTSTQTTQGTAVFVAQSDQSTTSTQTTAIRRIRETSSAESASLSLGATANRIPPFSSNQSVTATLTADATKFKRTSADLAATFTVPDIKVKHQANGIATLQQAIFTESVTGIRIRFADSAQSVTATQTATAVKTATAQSADSVTATQTTTAVKTVRVSVNNVVLFGSSIDADLTARPLVYLESQTSLSAIIGSIKQFQAEKPIQGVKFARPGIDDHFIQLYQNNEITIWDPQTAKFLISFWAWSPNGTVFDNYSAAIADKGNVKIYPDRVEFRDTATAHTYTGGQWVPTFGSGTGYNIQWTGLNTANWNHYILYRNGSQEPIKLYINGQDQGSPTVGQSYAGYLTLEPIDGFNRRLQWALGADHSQWYENINELTKAAQSTTVTEGALSQFVTWWESNTPDATDSAVRSKLYNNGYVDLGPQGTLSGLTRPRIFLNLQTYNDYANRGSYGLNYAEWREITSISYDPNWSNLPWTTTSDYTPTVSDQWSPGFFTIADLTANSVGVFLYIANISAQTALTATSTRIIGQSANLTVSVSESAQAQVTVGVISPQSVTTTLSVAITKTTGYFSDLTATATETAIIGYLRDQSSTQTVTATLEADPIKLLPTRAEADLSVTTAMSVDAQSYTDAEIIDLGVFTMTTEITVIPPIRTTANLTVNTNLTVTIGSIEQFAVLTQTSGTMVIEPVKTARPTVYLTVTATESIQAVKYTGAVVNISALHSTLIAGDVINIDPFLTLIIPQETRILTPKQETRSLLIEQETRQLIVEGYEQ